MSLRITMAKVNKTTLKATKNRDRVNFHRRFKNIFNNEVRQINQICNVQSVNQVHSKPEEQTEINASSKEKLRRWATKYNISKRAVSDLLKILISLGMNWLPRDSRTLLSTPRHIEMTNLTNGKLWYYSFFVFFHNKYCTRFQFLLQYVIDCNSKVENVPMHKFPMNMESK